jgi:hypothetical protein
MKILRLFLPILLLLPAGLMARGLSISPDTVFMLSLEVNMTKAVQRGIFDPSLDRLYAVFDQQPGEVQMVPSGDNKFTLLLSQGLDSGATYTFRFRINNFITETVTRQVTIKQGVNYYYCWWNDDYLNYTWLQVDMSYMVQKQLFRPDTDFVDVAGSMNLFQGSAPLSRMGSSYVYQIMYNLEPESIAAFRFRINGDTNKAELKGKPYRYLLAPDSTIHMRYFFDNYNPATVPMTFYCNMKLMTRKGLFSRQSDHVDVAGSFNGGGAYDILYDNDRDSIYNATLLIDTSFIGPAPITFKYRINSSWATAELQGEPFRVCTLIDTAGGFRNMDSSWFNNWNPAILTPPVAYNVNIQGKYIFKQVVTGAYSYLNINNIPEGPSTYRWYLSADSLGTNLTPIDTATHISYTIDTTCIHKWLVFEVTPVADSGDSAIGKPVRVITASSIGYVGIGGPENLITRISPNPFTNRFRIESAAGLTRIEIYDLSGRMVQAQSLPESVMHTIDCAIQPGLYLLKATGNGGQTGWTRILKQ